MPQINNQEEIETVPVSYCEPNRVLADDLHSPDGTPLAPAGKVLSDYLLRKIFQYDVEQLDVYVDAPPAQDLDEEPINDPPETIEDVQPEEPASSDTESQAETTASEQESEPELETSREDPTETVEPEVTDDPADRVTEESRDIEIELELQPADNRTTFVEGGEASVMVNTRGVAPDEIAVFFDGKMHQPDERGQTSISLDQSGTFDVVATYRGQAETTRTIEIEPARKKADREGGADFDQALEGLNHEEDPARVIIQQDLSRDVMLGKELVLKGDLKQGATVQTTADIRVEGTVYNGTLHSENGAVRIDGTVKRGPVRIISERPVQIQTIESAKIIAEGNIIVRNSIRDSEIQIEGSLIVHNLDYDAEVISSQLEINGRMLCDRLVHSDNPTRATFQDPRRYKLRDKNRALARQIQELQQKVEGMSKLTQAMRQLEGKVQSLPEKKQQALQKKSQQYEELSESLENKQQLQSKIETKLDQLEEQRWSFLRVVDEIEKGTKLRAENSELETRRDDSNIEAFSRNMIMINDADNQTVDVNEWLTEL